MGQSYSLNNNISRNEYDSMQVRCKGLEKANNELRNVVIEREDSIRQLRTSLSKTKGNMNSTQQKFTGVEKQLQEVRDKYSLIRPQLENLKVTAAEAQHAAIESAEEVEKLKLSNTALEKQATNADSQLASLQKELDEAEKSNSSTIDALKTKNTELRERMQEQQQEIASLKESIHMINNIVDST